MSVPEAASTLGPLLSSLLGESLPVRLRFWDGSTLGGHGAPATVVVASPRALRRLVFAPSELGLARAYVAGELDVEGDLDAVLSLHDRVAPPRQRAKVRLGLRRFAALLVAAARLGALGAPPRPPAEEVRLSGRRHSRRRDARAIAHHYDLSNDFYRLVLGPTMAYSCAYFVTHETSLDDAQAAKHELVCRKLGLRAGDRLLDVGCGWGAMVLHAARRYGVRATGITLSNAQAELARRRAEAEGLEDLVDIRVQDYREVNDGPYDAVSSIGMYEHVGLTRLREYFERLFALLRPEGRLLNHGISRPPSIGRFGPRSFVSRYVFPDGELHEVGTVVATAERAGFEVRDVESLREHYVHTLRSWVANLEAHFDEAVALVGAARARTWRLYMAGAARSFAEGRTSVHQVLAVRPGPRGESGMPPTRAAWLGVPTASPDGLGPSQAASGTPQTVRHRAVAP
jgi:cyclopropane-fatty-acyl-phospholipid synthase